MIEAVSDKNLEEVLPLVREYQEFYGILDISDDRNRSFFSQFSESGNDGCLFLYRNDEGAAVAFTTVYFSFVSSIPARVGVMNDLYIVPDYRGKGIGKRLINHCLKFALSKGAARLQWLTAEDNEQAQKLYDSLNTKKSTWKVYTYTA
ncbi:GNAT family N-acetyltransferase [Marinobacterium rhizophilum]|uniref:GNAT family N-acetyltransferase n=1 Tax=Marinobacterium rhizophilum TaxID=420402 RepID=UPI0009FDE707|nr:GNAT family N-acetyltransferase [Marinobacterium rhizophilum]